MRTTIDTNNDWRKTAAAIYRKPVDSKIFGQVELDVTDLEEFVAEKRKNGIKVTLTHFFTLATARALRYEIPELNVYVRRGRIISRKQVDAVVSLLMEGSEMSSLRLNNADRMTLDESSAIMTEETKKARKGDNDRTMDMKAVVASVPWPFRVWLVRLVKLLTITWGVSIKRFGLSPESFGSFMVSNIGTLGLTIGYPALFPISNLSFVLIIGAVEKRPWVVNNEVVPRKIITIGATLDHRICDGSHGGRLFRYLKFMTRNPHLLDENPE